MEAKKSSRIDLWPVVAGVMLPVVLCGGPVFTNMSDAPSSSKKTQVESHGFWELSFLGERLAENCFGRSNGSLQF